MLHDKRALSLLGARPSPWNAAGMLTTFRIDDALISYAVDGPLLAELALFPEPPIQVRGGPASSRDYVTGVARDVPGDGGARDGALYATGVPAARLRLDARGFTAPVCNATERILRNFLEDQPRTSSLALAPQELGLVQLLDGFEAIGRGYRGFLLPWAQLGLRLETTRFLQLVFLTVLLDGARNSGELLLQTGAIPEPRDPQAPPSAPVTTALARLEQELNAAPPLGPLRIDELPFLIRLNTLASVGRADAFPELSAQERALAPRTARPEAPPREPEPRRRLSTPQAFARGPARPTPRASAVSTAPSSWLPPESTPFRPWGKR